MMRGTGCPEGPSRLAVGSVERPLANGWEGCRIVRSCHFLCGITPLLGTISPSGNDVARDGRTQFRGRNTPPCHDHGATEERKCDEQRRVGDSDVEGPP